MNVSIVTITYNNFEELCRTIESTDKLNCERIVINGGSCIQTKNFLNSRSDLKSLSEKDKGISDAFNKGISLATNKCIWFLNSGDVCIDNNFVEFADTSIPDNDFVYSPIIFDDPEKGQYQMNPIPNRPLGLGITYLHPGLIVSSRVFKEIGGFDLNFKLAMDYELMCRMQNHGYRGAYFSNPTVLMDGTGVSKQKPFKGHIELGRALKKNHMLVGKNFACYLYRSIKLSTKYLFYWAGFGNSYEKIKNTIPDKWRK